MNFDGQMNFDAPARKQERQYSEGTFTGDSGPGLKQTYLSSMSQIKRSGDPSMYMTRKSLRTKRNIISENTGDRMTDTDTSWLNFKPQ